VITSFDLNIVNPLEHPGWDELLLSQQQYSFFHSSHWARVLTESYGYQPLYFTLIDRGTLNVMLPVMEVDSIITGKRGVSLPFTDYCELFLADHALWQPVLRYLTRYGKKAGWKYLELRSRRGVPKNVPSSRSFLGHTLNLQKGQEWLYAALRDSTKRNVRKAVREGLTVTRETSREAMEEFFRLNCLTRKRHGLPPQPAVFFKKIYEHIISPKYGSVFLARHQGSAIAGAICLQSREKVIYKYAASDHAYFHLRPNNLVLWEVIQWYSENQYQLLCLGKTDQDSKGLIQFKNGWGAENEFIHYYKYNFSEGAFVRDSRFLAALTTRVLKMMPDQCLRGIGHFLYRHAA